MFPRYIVCYSVREKLDAVLLTGGPVNTHLRRKNIKPNAISQPCMFKATGALIFTDLIIIYDLLKRTHLINAHQNCIYINTLKSRVKIRVKLKW